MPLVLLGWCLEYLGDKHQDVVNKNIVYKFIILNSIALDQLRQFSRGEGI